MRLGIIYCTWTKAVCIQLLVLLLDGLSEYVRLMEERFYLNKKYIDRLLQM